MAYKECSCVKRWSGWSPRELEQVLPNLNLSSSKMSLLARRVTALPSAVAARSRVAVRRAGGHAHDAHGHAGGDAHHDAAHEHLSDLAKTYHNTRAFAPGREVSAVDAEWLSRWLWLQSLQRQVHRRACGCEGRCGLIWHAVESMQWTPWLHVAP